VRYWRKGDRFKALSPEEAEDFQHWLAETLPRPSWLHADFQDATERDDEDPEPQDSSDDDDSSGETLFEVSPYPEYESEEGDEDTTLVDQSESEEVEQPAHWSYPLPLTGFHHPQWHTHSWVDANGHIFLIREAQQQQRIAEGYYRIDPCHWVLTHSPPVRRYHLDSGEPVPELRLTTPEGETGWLEDPIEYGAEVAAGWLDEYGDEDGDDGWGDGDYYSEEEEDPWFPNYDPFESY